MRAIARHSPAVRRAGRRAPGAPDVGGPDGYFPERTLSRWLSRNDLPSTVYAFPKVGVQPLRAAYGHLVSRLNLDALVLVDGGTDILMRGDEAGLGTPVEDITSLAAAAAVDVPVKLVTCLGFGIDAYHGVNHVPSIVNGQIAAALRGDFGDVQFTRRTSGSTLFVNPLMAVYFTVDLATLAARCLYLDRIEHTVGMRQVAGRIEAFREEISPRIPRAYPH